MNKSTNSSKNEVFLSNLHKLYNVIWQGIELRICDIAEYVNGVVDIIVSLAEDGFSYLGTLDSIAYALTHRADTVSTDNMDAESSLSHFIKSFDIAAFSRLVVDKSLDAGLGISILDFLQKGEILNSICYVRNALADEAFEIFSMGLSSPTVMYAENFKEACRFAKSEGGYCILPLVEGDGHRIPSIMRMIRDFDLKIVSITPVFGFDGNADVKYALLATDYVIPTIDSDDDLYIEISVPDSDDFLSYEFLALSEMLGLHEYTLNKYNYSRGGGSEYNFILSGNEKSCMYILAYLRIFLKSADVQGIYKNLE